MKCKITNVYIEYATVTNTSLRCNVNEFPYMHHIPKMNDYAP